jgi:hypothetical protein
MSSLRIPTEAESNKLVKDFALDLKSFTVIDEESKLIQPVICSICDSIPTKAQWSTSVHIDDFIELCHSGKLDKDESPKSYSQELRNQYTAKDTRLKDLILLPQTYASPSNEVLLCKKCLSELRSNSFERQTKRRRGPSESIIQGYMIGDAPDVLSNLNTVELSLITKTVTQCQRWILFLLVVMNLAKRSLEAKEVAGLDRDDYKAKAVERDDLAVRIHDWDFFLALGLAEEIWGRAWRKAAESIRPAAMRWWKRNQLRKCIKFKQTKTILGEFTEAEQGAITDALRRVNATTCGGNGKMAADHFIGTGMMTSSCRCEMGSNYGFGRNWCLPG